MKHFVILMNLLFITGIAYLGVKSGYDVLETQLEVSSAPRMAEMPTEALESQGQRNILHYQSIENRNLFQTQNVSDALLKKAPEPAPSDEPLKKTDLKLKLWGTISGDNLVARAIIEDPKTRKQTLLKSGESIENAVIKQILWNEVIISVNGKDEILEMEKPGAAPRVQPGAPPSPNPGFPASDAPAIRGSSGIRSENIMVARTEIDSAAANINDIMRQARFRPHYRDGKPSGLTVTNIQPNSIFTKLGLQSGDIIMGIDGQEIQTVDDALKFYTGLKSSSNLQLKIKRRGLERTLDYNIE